MELVLKTSGQKCLAGSNPAPSAKENLHDGYVLTPREEVESPKNRAIERFT